MTKRLIDVDDDLREKACTTLGTGTVNDTVSTALAEVVCAPLRRRHADRLERMQGLDLAEWDVMADAWRR
jgi:Arc/MetJ family transcription regulator